MIVPITSNRAGFPFQVLLSAEGTAIRTDAKAQAEQVRAVRWNA